VELLGGFVVDQSMQPLLLVGARVLVPVLALLVAAPLVRTAATSSADVPPAVDSIAVSRDDRDVRRSVASIRTTVGATLDPRLVGTWRRLSDDREFVVEPNGEVRLFGHPGCLDENWSTDNGHLTVVWVYPHRYRYFFASDGLLVLEDRARRMVFLRRTLDDGAGHSLLCDL
jgi:hypothetical protein